MGAIRFPNLGFEISVGKEFSVFGFSIAYYGITMALSMISGALIAYAEARRTGQKVENYIDYTIFGILGGILGARIYYVAFSWDQYKDNLLEIFNLRGGGIAIYGGVIGAVIVAIIFCKIKKMKFWQFADTAVLGLILGQIIGRWGNFFNREAFGSFTNGLFAMQIPVSDVSLYPIPESLMVVINGEAFVQVQPTFLYESVLNLVVLALLIIFRDKKKFYGETFLRYLMGYGVVRFIVEGFRTDQLQLFGVAVSQVLSVVLFVAALALTIVMRVRLHGKPAAIDPIPAKVKKGAVAETEDTADANEAAQEETESVEEAESVSDEEATDTADENADNTENN